MSDLERPELTVPTFCEGCPAARACRMGEIVIASAGSREPYNVRGSVYHLGPMISKTFVLAYDINNTYAEPVLLGDAYPGYDPEIVAREACAAIDACNSPVERQQSIFSKKTVCGAGVVRFSQRYQESGWRDVLSPDDLSSIKPYNVFAPAEFKRRRYREWKQEIAENPPPPISDEERERIDRIFAQNGAGSIEDSLRRHLLRRH